MQISQRKFLGPWRLFSSDTSSRTVLGSSGWNFNLWFRRFSFLCNTLPHKSHGNSLDSSKWWTLFTCLFKFSFWENEFPHILQEYSGLFSLWSNLCRSKLPLLANDLPQTSHENCSSFRLWFPSSSSKRIYLDQFQ